VSDTYQSGQKPKSSIVSSTFAQRLSAIFGYRVPNKAKTDFGRKYGLEFVEVDLNNDLYRIKQASIGNIFKSQGLSTQLQRYFDAYTKETMISYDNIVERQQRLNELRFAYYNCEFINRAVKLCADEATQLDQQNRIISVESSNLGFVQRVYELLTKWGVTQDRIHAACFDIELYGEAFWTQKVTMSGVEKIIPIGPAIIQERLEFNAMKMAEFLAQRDGWSKANVARNAKIQTLIDQYKNNKNMDFSENYAEMFETKLLGFELHDGIVFPPWAISHFRYDADNSEFFPYGRPPLLGCLAPFNQVAATMALQGLARSMSLPVTLYKVKTTPGGDPARVFDDVNTVREEYDNIGTRASSNGLEVYTVNTKIWIPDGLLDVEVKASESQIDFTGDIELYMDRVATASGIPKAYLDQEFGGFGNSGISLVEQYKPFARHVYTIQSVFLQGLGQLIRLHFAITGEYDYNTPFLLSMRFPANEMGEEQRNARTASLELTSSIMEMLQAALGLEDGEPLPEDVVTDIMSKYTFLDPTEIQRWIRLTNVQKLADEEAGGDEDEGDDDDDGGMDFGDDDGGDMEEKRRDTRHRLRDSRERKFQERRLKEVSQRYREVKMGLHVKALEDLHLQDTFGNGKHDVLIRYMEDDDKVFQSIKGFAEPAKKKLKEKTFADMMDQDDDSIDLAAEFLSDYVPPKSTIEKLNT
jgi:hypothetical protein